MKNGTNDTSEAKVAERNERVKKLYRYVTELARRLGDTTASCPTIGKLFSIHYEIQRQKLRDNCEKLLFLDTVNYGKKALELLWRKVYYDTISTAKKLRETDTESDGYIYSHIVCGIGHLHHFLSRLQVEMNYNSNGVDYKITSDDEESNENDIILQDEELQSARSVVHLCLIYLGDLCRYQVEIFQCVDPSIAARYYLQAAQVDLLLGMPYNQLGNLYMDRNYNLDSVCYYIQCLSCVTPFDGAMGNLTKIFEKNNQFYETLECLETSSQTEHVQTTVANFLSLIEIWYLSKNDTNIPQRCSKIAQQLKICMSFTKIPLPDIDKNYNEYLQAADEENINPSYLSANIIHKMVQICLFTLAKMTETDEANAFACKAFTLALLSQLLQRLLKDVEALGMKNPARRYKPKALSTKSTDAENNKHEEASDVITNGNSPSPPDKPTASPVSVSEKLPNGDGKIKKTTKRRRRRRHASSGSSDVSNAGTDTSDIDSDELSSEEGLSDSTYKSDDDSKSEGTDIDVSDIEDSTETTNGELVEVYPPNNLKEHEKINENITIADVNEIDSESNTELNEKAIQNFLLGDNFLSSIKLLQDWILTEKDLILSCGDSGEALFQCVVDLLNILTFHFNPKGKETNDKVLDCAKRIAKNYRLEYRSIPLPEDVNLRGTNICKFDKHAAEWKLLDKYNPSVYEETVIRILNFIDFGNQIAKLVPRIRFNRSMKIFYIKRTPQTRLGIKVNHKKTREWHNSKKPQAESGEGGLLRRLGQLWLTSQVRELERGQSGAPAPALLALDTAALNKHLRRVKQLLRARNFILLVPAVVLQELDELKREQSTARDAIRWLEAALRSGSRFLRAQRPSQTRPLPLLKYPRKAPPHVHNFIQILEFCNHFLADEKQNQGGNGDPENTLPVKSPPLLILLVGDEPASAEERYKDFSLTGAAQAAGITIENIEDFYAKWRSSIHKNGKKR